MRRVPTAPERAASPPQYASVSRRECVDGHRGQQRSYSWELGSEEGVGQLLKSGRGLTHLGPLSERREAKVTSETLLQDLSSRRQ